MTLLDTDIAVDLLREFPAAVSWLGSLGDQEIMIPGYVAMELIQGCQNKAEQERISRFLNAYEVVWPSPVICDQALSIFASFHLSHGLGLLDALIGQLAVSVDTPLHTFNPHLSRFLAVSL